VGPDRVLHGLPSPFADTLQAARQLLIAS